MLLATVVVVALTARLGWWQLDRASQKAALQQRIDSRAQAPLLEASALARQPAQAAEQHHRWVRLQGHWLGQHTVFLDNRQMQGRPGFFVLTPLQLSEGAVVLVQRGWVPRNFLDRQALPDVPTPAGMVQLLGRVAPPPGKLFELGQVPPGRIRQNLDLEVYARETGLQLLPLSVQQLDAAAATATGHAASGSGAQAPTADGLLRAWPAPAVDLSKHHGYAFQWFALCALTAGLYVWFQIIRPRRLKHRHGQS